MLVSKSEIASFSLAVVVKSILEMWSSILATKCSFSMMMAVDSASTTVTPQAAL